MSTANELAPAREARPTPARIEQYGDDMIVGTLTLLPAPERRAEILEVFRAVQGPAMTQPGCTSCRVFEEHGPDQAVVLVERWENEAALLAHLRSDTYRLVLGAIELSCSPPEVTFDYVSATAGMELIERSREQEVGLTDQRRDRRRRAS